MSDVNSHTPAPASSDQRNRTRRLVLGGGLAAMATGVGLFPSRASGAPGTDPWLLGGNTAVASNGSNYLGTHNVAPLIFKTAETNNNPAERMRITPAGPIGVGTTSPIAQLHVSIPTGTALRGQTTGAGTGNIGVQALTSNGNAIRANATGAGIGLRAIATSGKGVQSAATSGIAVHGSSASGTGILGQHTDATGTNPGVLGETNSTDGGAYGLIGRVNPTTPGGYSTAVRGINNGAGGSGIGVWGSHAGSGWGVYGSAGEFGVGMYGTAGTNGLGTYGVAGTDGFGAYGQGGYAGVYGYGSDDSGIGVQGQTHNSISSYLNARGVQGTGTVGVQGTGEYMGVQGTSLNYAVFGFTNPDTGGFGVYGRGGTGVKGRSYTGNAVLGDTDSGTGVKGEAYSDGGGVKAIHGLAFGVNANGVVGQADNGTSAYGVWGLSTGGYAGVFSGKVLVTGTLSKGGGSFQIDHPLDPTNKYLFHSFVESPDMMNVYNGNITTGADGTATVELPDYFEALNRDFRYQLTVIGEFAQAIVKSKVAGGKFVIATDQPRVEVSWQVTGIRKDPWADANRIPVTLDKAKEARGTYLHPEAYGKPASTQELAGRLASVTASAAAREPDPEPPAPSRPHEPVRPEQK